MSVVDGTSNATFLLWNETAKSMIGKTVPEVWDIFHQEHEELPDSDKSIFSEFSKFQVPQPIEDLIGGEYLFKVTVTERHMDGTEKVYIVDRYSDDNDMINSHKKIKHDVIANTSSSVKESIEETLSVQEENDNQTGAELKTPEFPKSGKRNLDYGLQEAEGHSSTMFSKST